YEGRDGYLFLTGGAHAVADYLSGRRQPTPASVAAFVANQQARVAFCKAHGLPFATWIFPEKLYCLRDLVPELGPLQSLYLTAYRPAMDDAAAADVLYPVAALDARPRCFLQTDTHYAPLGDAMVAGQVLDRLSPGAGLALRRAARAAMTVKRKLTGDLGTKLTPPRREVINDLEPLRPHRTGSIGIVGNLGAMFLVDSPESTTDQTLLIFGDSFFRVLLPLLAVHFRRIVFCRSPSFHAEMVDAVAPSAILCGMAERYLAECRPDADRPHFMAIGALRGKRAAPDAVFSELFGQFIDQRKLLSPAVLKGVQTA
ncbi:MAG: hypothetical protein ACRC14_15110, partial [Paracoccaceae bacterium]